MNWVAVHSALTSKLEDIKSARRGNSPELQRVLEVRRKVYTHIGKRNPSDLSLTRRPKPRPAQVKVANYVFEVTTRPNRMIAVDLEWHRRTGVITEIGYTIGSAEGVFSHNIIVDPKMLDHFEYGVSKRMALSTALRILKSEIAQSDLVVGHAFRNDIHQLIKNGVVPAPFFLFDTQRYAKRREERSLTSLCNQYGVDMPTAHVGGNDARATFELFFAMTGMEKYQ